MRDLDEYEALHNLNPCTDKLGKDRDFRENISNSVNFLTNKVKQLEKNVLQLMKNQSKLLQAIERRESDRQ